MKIIGLLAIQIISVIAANICFLWAIIEFLFYLVKDIEFNWWSIWSFVISVVIALSCIVIGVFVVENTSFNQTAYKSRFQTMIEQMEEKRKSFKI